MGLRTRLCGTFALLGLAFAPACGERAPASDPSAAPIGAIAAARATSLRIVGRTGCRSDGGSDGQRVAWSGTTIETVVRARSVVLWMRVASATPWTVRVDDAPPVVFETSPDREAYPLAHGLDPSRAHRIEVVREAEPSAGTDVVVGLALPEGGTAEAPPKRGRRIDVVGDSITCGYGVLGVNAFCSFSYATERASLAWGAVAGRMLDADVTTESWSGRGVLQGFDGSRERQLPVLWDRALPSDPAPFDFGAAARSGDEPDAVVLGAGTNDALGPIFGKAPPLDVRAFEDAYVAFLAHVRAVHPRALILVATSPMIPPEKGLRDAFAASLGRVVAARNAAHDERVELLDLPFQETRLGCDFHPNVEHQQRMADALAARLRARLGW